jgi:hypothetical protein
MKARVQEAGTSAYPAAKHLLPLFCASIRRSFMTQGDELKCMICARSYSQLVERRHNLLSQQGPLRNEICPNGINGHNGEEKVYWELHVSVRPDEASGGQEATHSALALLIDVANVFSTTRVHWLQLVILTSATATSSSSPTIYSLTKHVVSFAASNS